MTRMTLRRPPALDDLAGDAVADPIGALHESGAPIGARREPAAPAGDAVRVRLVARAATELRRGAPVILQDGATGLVLLAADTAAPAGLADFAALAEERPVLLLSPVRAAAVLRRPVAPSGPPVALRLPSVPSGAWLQGLADPTEDQAPEPPPELATAPPGAAAALALAKIARLLPAVLAAPLRAGGAEEAAHRALLSVRSADIALYPESVRPLLRQVAAVPLPLEDAPDCRIVAFRAAEAGIEHLAILVGTPETAAAPLVRVHSECFTGDLLGSLRCDCGPQLRGAIRRMAEEGAGVLLYLAQEGRGIGLVNKLRAYALQDRGLDTLDANRALGWEADERSFLAAATMLDALGIRRIRLLTNNPDKVAALSAAGVEVVGRESHAFAANGVNDRYLATKAARFGHLLG